MTIRGSGTDSLDGFSCSGFKRHTPSLFQFVKSRHKSVLEHGVLVLALYRHGSLRVKQH